jgi:hypothetical protein
MRVDHNSSATNILCSHFFFIFTTTLLSSTNTEEVNSFLHDFMTHQGTAWVRTKLSTWGTMHTVPPRDDSY